MCSFPRVQNTKNGEYMFPPLAPGCLPKIVMKSVRWTGGELLRNGWNTCGTLKNGRTCVSLLRLVRFRGSHKASKSLLILAYKKFGTAEMHGDCAFRSQYAMLASVSRCFGEVIVTTEWTTPSHVSTLGLSLNQPQVKEDV